MKLGPLFTSFCQRLKIDVSKITDPAFTGLLSSDIEVPEEVANQLDKGLITIDAAKSNADITKHFRHSILSPADTEMDNLITELGLQPGDDFVGNKNTYTKIKQLVLLANEAGKKAAGAGNKTDANEFAKKELELRNKITELTNSLTSKETEFNTARQTDQTTFALEKILLSKSLALPKEMDGDLKIATAMGAVNKKLAAKGLIIKRDAETGNLSVVNKADGTPAYAENSVPHEVTTFIDAALAENKLLEINDPNKVVNPGSGNNTKDLGGKTGGGNAAMQAEFNAQLAAMDNLPG